MKKNMCPFYPKPSNMKGPPLPQVWCQFEFGHLQGDYKELVSCSNCTDFQSRALDIRSRDGKAGVCGMSREVEQHGSWDFFWGIRRHGKKMEQKWKTQEVKQAGSCASTDFRRWDHLVGHWSPLSTSSPSKWSSGDSAAPSLCHHKEMTPEVHFCGKSGWNTTKMVFVLEMRDDLLGQGWQPILIMDCARCHILRSVIAKAKALGFWMVFVPAHLTFLLQPLDIDAFAPTQAVSAEKTWPNLDLSDTTTQLHAPLRRRRLGSFCDHLFTIFLM